MDPLPPSPTASPTPKVITPKPAPTINVTGTVHVEQKPDDVPLTDHLQGWGTVGAVVVALLIALIGWRVDACRREKDRTDGDIQREQDRKYAESQRAEDRADADRRLHEERAAADKRLQVQLGEQRDRDLRAFMIVQLQRAGDLYAELKGVQREFNEQRFSPRDDPGRRYAERVATQRLRAHLLTVSPPYGSLLKTQFFGSSSVDEATLREAIRRAPDDNGDAVGPIDDGEIFRELADNIAELLGHSEPGHE